MEDIPSHSYVKILDQKLIEQEDGKLTYQVTECLSTSSKVVTVTSVGLRLKPNKLTEVNWEYEVQACTSVLLSKGSFEHRFVCIDLSNYPVVSARVIPQVPVPSSDRFDNDIYNVYKDLSENECALIMVNTNVPFTGLKRVTIVLPKK